MIFKQNVCLKTIVRIIEKFCLLILKIFLFNYSHIQVNKQNPKIVMRVIYLSFTLFLLLRVLLEKPSQKLSKKGKSIYWKRYPDLINQNVRKLSINKPFFNS